MFTLKEMVLSSQIEGANASLSDVLEYEAKMHAAERSIEIKKVTNYVEAATPADF